MDYKTDHVSKQDGADILKKRYKRQLDELSADTGADDSEKSPSEIDLLVCLKVLDEI